MKRILHILAILLPVTASAQTDLTTVRQAGLCVVEITTMDGEEPQGQIITKPGEPDNHNMTYLNKVPCRIVITKGTETHYDSGPYLKKSSGATIRINGNTSAYYSEPLNMPYKIKLETAADLLLRGDDDKYKDKDWRLLKDAVSLNTIVGLKLSQIIGLEWTSSYMPCNVIINGDYRGCYLLMETMKRNQRCRVDCDKESGYIIEKDPYWWKESKYFESPWYRDASIYRWTWKYPDEDDVTENQELYIKQYVEAMEGSLDDEDYEKYIDIGSFSKWLLAHDILGTRDSGGSNMYLKKYDNTDNSLLELPCLWDFDSSYEVTPGSFSRIHTSTIEYFQPLMNNRFNRTFAAAYVALWNDKKETIVNELTNFVNNYTASDEGKALDASRKLYNKRFNYYYGSVDDDVQLTLNWLRRHIEPLDQQIQLINTTPSGVSMPSDNGKLKATSYYNAHGMRVNAPSEHGITVCRRSDGKVVKVSPVKRH